MYIMLPEITKNEAISIFANYCSQNSTPADIFDFDGTIPTAKLKYSPIIGTYADFTYTALVEITTESEYNTTSQLGANTTAAKNNARNPSGGFFESMYEDFYDTRYETTKATNKYMDRSNGTGWVLAFGSSGNPADTVEEKLWPQESVSKDYLLEFEDYRIQTDALVLEAVSKSIANSNFDNAEYPTEKLNAFISEYINDDLSHRYSNCNYKLIDAQYNAEDDDIVITPLFFPYYEFTFPYKGYTYQVRICAHRQGEASTGLFGGKKEIAVGDLPTFVKEPGGLITKIKARKERKNEKQEGKENFLNEVASAIYFLA